MNCEKLADILKLIELMTYTAMTEATGIAPGKKQKAFARILQGILNLRQYTAEYADKNLSVLNCIKLEDRLEQNVWRLGNGNIAIFYALIVEAIEKGNKSKEAEDE